MPQHSVDDNLNQLLDAIGNEECDLRAARDALDRLATATLQSDLRDALLPQAACRRLTAFLNKADVTGGHAAQSNLLLPGYCVAATWACSSSWAQLLHLPRSMPAPVQCTSEFLTSLRCVSSDMCALLPAGESMHMACVAASVLSVSAARMQQLASDPQIIRCAEDDQLSLTVQSGSPVRRLRGERHQAAIAQNPCRRAACLGRR